MACKGHVSSFFMGCIYIVRSHCFWYYTATTALCSVIHKWYDKDFDIPIYKTFLSAYKTQFKKSNALGFVLVLVALFLYMDLQISQDIIQSFYFHALILIISFLCSITAIYLFPIFVRYNLTFFSYFKQSLFIALARPMETIAILVSFVLLYFVFSFVPVLFVFAGSSLIATPMVWFAYRACLHVEEKKVHIGETKTVKN
ncbi:YesL family protein [Alkalicoccobacillus plakortidis]|uniref:DUF624 domain-containing protein n=1 Tax=Alkalicoccobacillus plakortidis TaxID=444060 RepID=A0ABT0XQB8_9BACI|nr:DUF624 domain-containing protein [Alkalicoccobacillus plakortidis]MCM2677965.1 DUF624 domain-containing protein [Alkalicoccobacillus plakortidis]